MSQHTLLLIRTNLIGKVKKSLFMKKNICFFFLCFFLKTAFAENIQKPEDPSSAFETGYQLPQEEPIQAIEAEEFQVTLVRTSKSKRVVLFDFASNDDPKPGKILLIKEDKDNLVAVRVLKNYPQQFAAKIVLNFDENTEKLQPQKSYRALKKLGNKILQMIREREALERTQQGKDLDAAATDEELSQQVSPSDEELDRGLLGPPRTPEPNAKDGQKNNTHSNAANSNLPEPLFTKDGKEIDSGEEEGLNESENEDGLQQPLAVQEIVPLEPHRHSITAQYSSILNVDKNRKNAHYRSIGARYSYLFALKPFINKKNIQDGLSLEASTFYYTITGFYRTDDHVTVIPFMLAGRYHVFIGTQFSIFGYLGVLKNNVFQGEGELTTSTTILATTNVAAGLGTNLNIGPGWSIRLDVGLEMVALGATLRF